MICVDAESIGVRVADKDLFTEVSLTVRRGDRVAVIGVNGTGKSTLLRVLAGVQEPDSGTIRFGRGLRVARLDQDPVLPSGTVAEHLLSGRSPAWEVEAVASRLGVLEHFERRTDTLSGGQAKRVALVEVLTGNADLIVLDEPTNHLDVEAIDWLEARLARESAALVFVTHDRYLMDRLTTARGAGTIVEIERGSCFTYLAAAGTSAYSVALDGQAQRASAEASAEATRRILARRELAWLQRGAPARSTKAKARVRSATEIVNGGPAPAGLRSRALVFGSGTARLGNQVVSLEGVSRAYGDRMVLRDVDLTIEPGARLGVVGPNGSGKSTLLALIAGRAEPSAGTVRRGSTVVCGFADQHSVELDPEAIVRELVAGEGRAPDHEDRRLLERFWFDATAQYAPVRMLSGGERRRLLLVMVLATGPNLVVLDEPTNDLDLDTLRALEDFFESWPGALVVASHDRSFLDRTVDHVVEVTADGAVVGVPGGVAGWLAGRTAARSDSPRPGAKSPAAVVAPGGAATKRVSSSTLTRQLREIERSLDRLGTQRDALIAALAIAADHHELARLGAELSTVTASLAELEEAWLVIADESG